MNVPDNELDNYDLFVGELEPITRKIIKMLVYSKTHSLSIDQRKILNVKLRLFDCELGVYIVDRVWRCVTDVETAHRGGKRVSDVMDALPKMLKGWEPEILAILELLVVQGYLSKRVKTFSHDGAVVCSESDPAFYHPHLWRKFVELTKGEQHGSKEERAGRIRSGLRSASGNLVKPDIGKPTD